MSEVSPKNKNVNINQGTTTNPLQVLALDNKRNKGFFFVLSSFICTIDFVEGTSVNNVFLSHDSAIQAHLIAFAAPSVRKNSNIFDRCSSFVTTQQMKCKHFFVFAAPKFGFSLTYLYLCPQ